MTSIDYSSLGTSNIRKETENDHHELRRLMNQRWESIRDFSKKSRPEIRQFQFERIQELVNHAFNTVELYREKYSAVGFQPGDLRSWEDFQRLPILTKKELIAGFPNKTISTEFGTEFTTRSSGSSGQFVTIAVSPQAVYLDTIQGARQFHFQSEGNYKPEDLVLFIYTSPWWVSSIDGEYPTEFLSTSAGIEEAVGLIEKFRPKIISTYPTYLRKMRAAELDLKNRGIELVVIHSEQSTQSERKELSDFFRVNILDEFSSEELTRIALECPYRNYHLEEDACYIEIVDANGLSRDPIGADNEGLVIGTNLLNEATPIIRYSQGDIAKITSEGNCSCGSNFRIMESPQGRYMDSFVFEDRVVPAGCFMDLAYNWYLELDVPVHGLSYQIIQNRRGDINVFLVPGSFGLSPAQLGRVRESFYRLVPREVEVKTSIVNEAPFTGGEKYRPVISMVKRA